jgi:type IV pilus assembly protein PilB
MSDIIKGPMRKKIGEVVLAAGLVTQEQLENALNLQKGKKKKLGKVLIELGYATENQIAEVLSKQLLLPLVDWDNKIVDKKLLKLIPREVVESRLIFPIEITEKGLVIAMADPLDWEAIDNIRFMTGFRISIAVATESSITNAIENNYGTTERAWDLLHEIPEYDEVEFVKTISVEEENVNIQSLFKLSEAPPVIRFVTMILADAAKAKASDIHIEPMEKNPQVRYRIDGVLRKVFTFPRHMQDSVISRIKIISNLDITNRRLPQDGRTTLKFEGRNLELRVSTLPTAHGENIVIRLLDTSQGLIPLSKIGLNEKILRQVVGILNRPQGMFLVTGPTGSGKTTTLYAMLKQLQSEQEKIITIEDPVEYKLPGIMQVGVKEGIGFTFATALRSILRQDPDIIMVGEIRDKDTVEIAVRAALTGHFVLSTVHTNDTVSTITRLIDLGLEPFLVSSAVSGIFAQRLVRKICDKCKIEMDFNAEVENWKVPPIKKCYKGQGCEACHHTGYKGRIGVYEFLVIDTKLRRLLAKRATEDEIWEAAKENGLITLFEDAWEKVKAGTTSVEEVLSKVPYKHIEHSEIRLEAE